MPGTGPHSFADEGMRPKTVGIGDREFTPHPAGTAMVFEVVASAAVLAESGMTPCANSVALEPKW